MVIHTHTHTVPLKSADSLLLITNKGEILSGMPTAFQWSSEHTSQHYRRGTKKSSGYANICPVPWWSQHCNQCHEELQGSDGIPAEIVKHWGETLMRQLHGNSLNIQRVLKKMYCTTSMMPPLSPHTRGKVKVQLWQLPRYLITYEHWKDSGQSTLIVCYATSLIVCYQTHNAVSGQCEEQQTYL